jgi:hypothetical protein
LVMTKFPVTLVVVIGLVILMAVVAAISIKNGRR